MGGTYLRVGLLLILSLALGVGLVLFLGRNRVSDGLRYETYFRETVQGLDVGAPVKFRGVTLGQVSEIALVTAAYKTNESASVTEAVNRLVVVRFVVDPRKLGQFSDTPSAVKAGLRTRLAAQGITGLAYVELDFVDPSRFPIDEVPWQPKETYIPSMPSTISQIQDAAQALATKLQDVDIAGLAAAIEGLVNDARVQLGSGELSRALADAADLMRVLRSGAEGADLPGLLAELRATVAAVRGLADGKPSRDLLTATTRAAEKLSDAATRLPALIVTLETALRRVNNGTADAQAELLPTLRDARAAAASLRETGEALRRYPAAVLFGGPPPRARP